MSVCEAYSFEVNVQWWLCVVIVSAARTAMPGVTDQSAISRNPSRDDEHLRDPE